MIHWEKLLLAFMHGRHTVPVLQLRWVKRDPEKGDSLISIALDGKILEWHMQKGFMFKPLMVLKRVGEHNGPITRYASGKHFFTAETGDFNFDFDMNMYNTK